MTWLITGGAGYIGSHIVNAFLQAGHDVIVIDDLSTGHQDFLPSGVRFYRGNVLDRNLLDTIFNLGVTGVIHTAGFKFAGESVKNPIYCYEQNVLATMVLLSAMKEAAVDLIVFSSSAAVYGTPSEELVTEVTTTRPESPYGETKLVAEWLLKNEERASSLKHTSLRYFNVVGSGLPNVKDTSPHNLLPSIFKKLLSGESPYIFGNDYETPDGTCVRDYVHVSDIAAAHVIAAERLQRGDTLLPVYNLGSGAGFSVAEIMAAVAEVTGIEFMPEIRERRGGDPDRIVASKDLAMRDLSWSNNFSLKQIISSAWEAEIC